MRKSFAAIIFLGTLLLIGCGQKRTAIGDENKVTVICPRPDRAQVRDALELVFSDTLFTPQPEPYYRIEFADVEEYNRYKTHINFIVVGLGTDENNPGNRLVKQLLSAVNYRQSKNGGEALFLTGDLAAENQLYVVMSATDTDHLNRQMQKHRKWLRRQFDELFDRRQSGYIFDHARQELPEEQLFGKYGWGIKIPWGYEILRDSPDSSFFWMGRDLPYRWVSVSWERGLTVKNEQEARKRTLAYGQEKYGDIRFIDHLYQLDQRPFIDWTAWRSSGLWESVGEPKGGPFFHYIFYDGITDRTYEINGLVFFPGKDKIIVMRQLEILLKSFYVETTTG